MQTLLTADWLKNNFAYAMPGDPSFQKAKFSDYYYAACGYIRAHHFLRPTPAQIEGYLANGSYTYDDGFEETTVECAIEDADERKRLFLTAQAKQLVYDFTNGRGAMIRGADAKYNVCPDFVDTIKLLGLYQRTPTTV